MEKNVENKATYYCPKDCSNKCEVTITFDDEPRRTQWIPCIMSYKEHNPKSVSGTIQFKLNEIVYDERYYFTCICCKNGFRKEDYRWDGELYYINQKTGHKVMLDKGYNIMEDCLVCNDCIEVYGRNEYEYRAWN